MKQKYTLVSNFQCLGVPFEQSKLVGPSTCLTFLSIQVNTEALLLRLPKEKLEQLKQELSYCSYSLENNHQKGMVFPYSGIGIPYSLNSMVFQMLLILGVVEVTGAYIGFSLNGQIIYVPSQSPPKNSYRSWWQQQYLPISGRVNRFNSQ